MLAQILAAIKQAEIIIIHRHQRPDPDALGSQMGLKAALEATYPDKIIYAVGFDEPSLSHFGLMDQINDNIYKESLVIVTDTANTPRIDDDRFASGSQGLIKIDHHPNNDAYGDLSIVDTEMSSTSELLASIVFQVDNDLVMNDLAARNFFLGIVGDTGRFLFDNTTAHTMEIAAKLRGFNFPASELMQNSNTMTMAQAKLQSFVLGNMQISENGLVNSVRLTTELLADLGLTEAETHSIVQLPGALERVQAWVIFVEQADTSYRCRIRSKGPVINTIAEKHHGGGHPKASGANAYSEAEIADILRELNTAAVGFVEGK